MGAVDGAGASRGLEVLEVTTRASVACDDDSACGAVA